MPSRRAADGGEAGRKGRRVLATFQVKLDYAAAGNVHRAGNGFRQSSSGNQFLS